MLSRLSPIALAALGVLLLCGMDAVIKHLTASNGTLAIVFGRYLFGAAAAVIIWNAAGRPAITREMLRAHAVRGLLLVSSATGFFYAISTLELAVANFDVDRRQGGHTAVAPPPIGLRDRAN